MVKDFGKLGLVERRAGVADDPEQPPPALRNLRCLHVPEAADSGDGVVAAALAHTDVPQEQVMAGYFEKVERSPDER